MNQLSILVVEHDAPARNHLSHYFALRGYRVECLDSEEGLIERVTRPNPPMAVILDIPVSRTNGLDILARIGQLADPVPVIVVSAAGEVRTVVNAMRTGACDYLVKPFEDHELEQSLEQVLKKQKAASKHGRNGFRSPDGEVDIISADPNILRIKQVAMLVAETDVPVLISGESGVGKEVWARFIHTHSKQCSKPFLRVNCAAVPADLLESELFGYERGAFTGAVREKPGKFQAANNGTIFLDEIAEMCPQLQAKLLHVLQDGEFTPLGATRPSRADVRVLAATNKVLENAVATGQFRQDLYFRLNVIGIKLPPLRDRLEDVPLLCHHFLKKYSDKYGDSINRVPPQLMEAFFRCRWPGNIRQLENIIRRFLILRDPELVLSDLKESFCHAETPTSDTLSLREASSRAAESAEKELILHTLDLTHWNRKQAARELNMCYRSLLKKLRKWGISTAGRKPSAKISSGGLDTTEAAELEVARKFCASGG